MTLLELLFRQAINGTVIHGSSCSTGIKLYDRERILRCDELMYVRNCLADLQEQSDADVVMDADLLDRPGACIAIALFG
eukprot:4266368-Amphidinium_carterae.1